MSRHPTFSFPQSFTRSPADKKTGRSISLILISGPLRSAMIGIESFIPLKRLIVSLWYSWLPWLMLIRATSIPALIISLMTAGFREQGPNVQTIFVFFIGILWDISHY